MNDTISNLTCTFENAEFEKRYLADKWLKVKKFYRNMLIGFIILNLLTIFNILSKGNMQFQSIFTNAVFIVFSIIFFLVSDSFREKFIEISFAILFSILIPIWFYTDFDRLSNLPHIVAMPLLMSVICLNLFPFNFLKAFIVSSISFVSSIALVQNFPTITVPVFIIIYIFPFTVLLVNKWKIEIDNRMDFSKSVQINDTKKLMHETLKRYFGDVLSEKILSHKGRIEGETRWVTICFTDISAYSTIIEHMSPGVAVKFLNEYFNSMHTIIEKYNGQILNYIGDSIMMVFGAPNNLEDHEKIAVECAIDMRNELVKLNNKWHENQLSRYWKNHGIDNIYVRTGIHTGNVIAGNIGSEKMLQYSTIGDVVNVASRLENANKDFNTNICMSQEVYSALTDDLIDQAEFVGEITLKGRKMVSKVYSI